MTFYFRSWRYSRSDNCAASDEAHDQATDPANAHPSDSNHPHQINDNQLDHDPNDHDDHEDDCETNKRRAGLPRRFPSASSVPILPVLRFQHE